MPWRAGNERLGALIAYGTRRPEGFKEENAIVLIAAGHAAGLVWQRKRAEQKLAERAEELESLERAKSSFLLLASHELRTTLTLLNGYVSILADGSQSPERLAEILPILQQALERMNILVEQLIDATRVADSKLRLGAAGGRSQDRGGERRQPHRPSLAPRGGPSILCAGDRVRRDLRLGPGLARLVVRDEGSA